MALWYAFIWILMAAWAPAALAQASPETKAVAGKAMPEKAQRQALPKSFIVDSDGKAKQLVERILKEYGLLLSANDWKIVITLDPEETRDARSTYDTENQKRVIVFSRQFLDKISANSSVDWPLYAIAAHEVGHQLGNHVFRPYLRRKLAERAADYHTGFVLGKMGASYPQTVNVIRWLPDGDTSDNYPPREQRICEMGRGWRDARGLPAIPADDPKSSGESQTCVGERIDDAKFDVLENHDIYGSDLLFGGAPEIVGIDVAACAKKCLSTKECKAFSFDRWQGACYLKSKIAGAQLHPPSLIGVRVPEDLPDKLRKLPTKFTVNRNRRFFDSGGSVPVAAKDDKACLERCEKQPACIAFNYDKKSLNCKTFTKVGGPYVDDSTDSGYREQYDPKIP